MSTIRWIVAYMAAWILLALRRLREKLMRSLFVCSIIMLAIMAADSQACCLRPFRAVRAWRANRPAVVRVVRPKAFVVRPVVVPMPRLDIIPGCEIGQCGACPVR